MTNDQPKTARDVMEEAARELETEALTKRFSEGNDPLTPVADADEENVYEIPPEHQVPPEQVIEEEGLGVK